MMYNIAAVVNDTLLHVWKLPRVNIKKFSSQENSVTFMVMILTRIIFISQYIQVSIIIYLKLI